MLLMAGLTSNPLSPQTFFIIPLLGDSCQCYIQLKGVTLNTMKDYSKLSGLYSGLRIAPRTHLLLDCSIKFVYKS